MQDTAGEAGTNSWEMYSYGPPHMAVQKQDDQQWIIVSLRKWVCSLEGLKNYHMTFQKSIIPFFTSVLWTVEMCLSPDHER